MSFFGRLLIGFFIPFFQNMLFPSLIPPPFFFLYTKKGLISDLIKNKYKLPRSYLLAPIAMLFFVSQLILVTVGSITQLWIASLLLGLAHGSLYSLYPTLCLEWFGMGTYQHLPPLKNLSHSYPNSFFFRSSGSFTQHSPLF